MGRIVQFLTLLSIAVAGSTAQAQIAPATGWRVSAYFAPKLPAGVIPQFAVDIVEPANCLCDLDVRQSLFEGSFAVSVQATSRSAPKPFHILFRIRAAGFSPSLLSTGILEFDKTDWALVKALHFGPIPVEVPSVVEVTELMGGRSASAVIELAVNNPTAADLSAIRLAVYGWHTFLGPDQMCAEMFPIYIIELFAKGSEIFGTAKDAAGTDLFSYPVQGSYLPYGCHNADSFGFDVPIIVTLPGRKITRLRFDIRPERIIKGWLREETKPDDLLSGLNWRLLLVLSNDITLDAKLIEERNDKFKSLFRRKNK